MDCTESQWTEINLLLLLTVLLSSIIPGVSISETSVNYAFAVSFSGFIFMIKLSDGPYAFFRTLTDRTRFLANTKMKAKIRLLNSDVFFHSRVGSSDAQ